MLPAERTGEKLDVPITRIDAHAPRKVDGATRRDGDGIGDRVRDEPGRGLDQLPLDDVVEESRTPAAGGRDRIAPVHLRGVVPPVRRVEFVCLRLGNRLAVELDRRARAQIAKEDANQEITSCLPVDAGEEKPVSGARLPDLVRVRVEASRRA